MCLINEIVSPCCFLSTPLSPALSLPSLPALLFFRYLKPDENKKSKHKTAVKKKTLNPEFNEVKSTTMAPLLQIHFGFLSPPIFSLPKSSVYPVLSHLHNPETYQSHSERAQLSHRKGELLSKFIPRWLFERAAELNPSVVQYATKFIHVVQVSFGSTEPHLLEIINVSHKRLRPWTQPCLCHLLIHCCHLYYLFKGPENIFSLYERSYMNTQLSLFHIFVLELLSGFKWAELIQEKVMSHFAPFESKCDISRGDFLSGN